MTERTYLITAPPSANSMWRHVKGRVLLSKPYRLWRAQAGWELLSQRPDKIRGPVKIDLVFGFQDNRRRDPDNRVKPTLDLLRAVGLIEDDNSRIVRKISVESSRSFAGARITIRPVSLVEREAA